MTELTSIKRYFIQLQEDICHSLESVDKLAKFSSDTWERPEGGGGDSRLIQHGNVFEKGGVNFSHVFGKLPDILKSETRSANYFDATGVSIVIHPRNPFIPIIHMNVRYFQMTDKVGGTLVDSWFGGGIDLTPAYVFDEDAVQFHRAMRSACDSHDLTYYERFKKWCDEYFYISHRKEMRGIGGIFFDHLRPDNAHTKEDLFAFTRSVANAFAPIYSHIVKRRKHHDFNEDQRQWQLIRRGRYVEFNLVYDRGTSFGLKTNGRIESILMSMPPQANWLYDHQPEVDSPEYRSQQKYQPRDWLGGSTA